MIEIIQENSGKILKVKSFSMYNYGVEADDHVNKFLEKYSDGIFDIQALGSQNGRLLVFYYDKLESGEDG